ncbi:MAG: hypothetical protein IT285_02265 [Bdellovibrionales bacterium]|nr:hypothetical protein [Bdellovibrionales bacterium]
MNRGREKNHSAGRGLKSGAPASVGALVALSALLQGGALSEIELVAECATGGGMHAAIEGGRDNEGGNESDSTVGYNDLVVPTGVSGPGGIQVYNCESHAMASVGSMADLSTDPLPPREVIPEIADASASGSGAVETAPVAPAEAPVQAHPSDAGDECFDLAADRGREPRLPRLRPGREPTSTATPVVPVPGTETATPVPAAPGTVAGSGGGSAAVAGGGGGRLPGPMWMEYSDPTRRSSQDQAILNTGTPGGEEPNPPMSVSNLETGLQAVRLSDRARGSELLEAALTRRRAIQRAAEEDHDALAKPYERLEAGTLARYMDSARNRLERAANVLDTVGLDGAAAVETGRFRNYHLNARDRADAASRLLGEEMQRSDLESRSLLSLFGGNGPRQGNLERELADLLGTGSDASAATSHEGLVGRLLRLNGLPDAQRRALLSQLRLVENRKLGLKNGETVEINLVHNGYVFGGGKSAVDCSSFVSSVLPPEVRKGALTTTDFRAMWIYAKSGRFPAPPKYEAKRATLVQKVSTAFDPIDIYQGESLSPGDILVFRLPWTTSGHIYIVRDFNPRTLQVQAVDASQTASTVREINFNLSLTPLKYKIRRPRAGFLALRLKPVETEVCTYGDGRSGGGGTRAPASQRGTPSSGDNGRVRGTAL